MIRYAGMILIAASCTAGGFFFSDRIKYRLRQIESFIHFFENIIGYIETYNYPVEKIFITYQAKNNGHGKNTGFFLEKLIKNGRVDGIYKNPWETSLRECADEGLIFFTDEELGVIKGFGERLGDGRAEEQAAHMKLYYGKLKKIYEKASERELNLARLYRWSGGLTGIFVCILLM